MPPKHTVRVWWDKDAQGYRIEAPYSKEFINGLKMIIPANDRAWDPDTKIWLVTEKWFQGIKIVADRLFAGQTYYFTREQAEKATTTPAVQKASMDTVLLEFVKLLPPDALKRAYLVASMALHPDRGGSMDKMSALNALWQRIEKERMPKG